MEGSDSISKNTVEDKASLVDEQSSSGGGGEEVEQGLIASIISEILYSPLNLLLVVIIAVLIYKIIKGRFEEQSTDTVPKEPTLPKMKKRDFTVKELRQYDGTGPDGRILMAVNGSVYDVTNGRRFYGPGGPYAAFGGRDASRGLATFQVTARETEEYDDLSDLTSEEMGCVNEWESQLKERYDYVGKLLKPGETPTNYSDEDDDGSPTTGGVETIGNAEKKVDSEKSGDGSSKSTESTDATTTNKETNPDSDVRKRVTTTQD